MQGKAELPIASQNTFLTVNLNMASFKVILICLAIAVGSAYNGR